ncbi:MAG: SAM-dependent methyltransferase [Gammaproteobacteria bacterium]|nr:SAM-dependent methyltransferase [Gammaproteobacteria bacterium]
MSNKTFTVPDDLYRYLLSVSLRESDVLRRLREETAQHPRAGMQIAPEQGQFMALLARLAGARCALEVGVFTGYSSICVAETLPADGRLVACDVSEEYTGMARRYWRAAGVEDKIDLRLAPAVETLDTLVAGGEGGTFDFAFIDADKGGYESYFERCLELVRTGGLIAVDNTLWHGQVLDAEDESDDTEAIRAFNEQRHRDPRVALSLVPIGDGLTLALKL